MRSLRGLVTLYALFTRLNKYVSLRLRMQTEYLMRKHDSPILWC